MCQFPITRERANYSRDSRRFYDVPCGKCSHCIKLRVSQWTFRLKQERKRSSSCLFTTLTYNDDFIPASKEGYYSLQKSDLQNFFKRLRKYPDSKNLKYFAVGEYGSRFQRPHYHAILYNTTSDDVRSAWSFQGQEIGFVDAEPIKHDGGLLYCVSYIQGLKPHENRLPEFSLMSKHLGANYMTDRMIDWHKTDLSRCYVQDGTYKLPMPRYYKDRIYEPWELEIVNEYLQAKSDEKIQWIKDIIERDDRVLDSDTVIELRKRKAKHIRTVERRHF